MVLHAFCARKNDGPAKVGLCGIIQGGTPPPRVEGRGAGIPFECGAGALACVRRAATIRYHYIACGDCRKGWQALPASAAEGGRATYELGRMTDRCNVISTVRTGWGIGIRTPIPWSRATCPAVGRSPRRPREKAPARGRTRARNSHNQPEVNPDRAGARIDSSALFLACLLDQQSCHMLF